MNLDDKKSVISFLESTEANLRIWSERIKDINEHVRQLRSERDQIEQERANAILGVKHILLKISAPEK